MAFVFFVMAKKDYFHIKIINKFTQTFYWKFLVFISLLLLNILFENTTLLLLYCTVTFVINQLTIHVWVYCCLSILFLWSTFVWLYQYHTVLIITTLQNVSIYGSLNPRLFLNFLISIYILESVFQNPQKSSQELVEGDRLSLTFRLTEVYLHFYNMQHYFYFALFLFFCVLKCYFYCMIP